MEFNLLNRYDCSIDNNAALTIQDRFFIMLLIALAILLDTEQVSRVPASRKSDQQVPEKTWAGYAAKTPSSLNPPLTTPESTAISTILIPSHNFFFLLALSFVSPYTNIIAFTTLIQFCYTSFLFLHSFGRPFNPHLGVLPSFAATKIFQRLIQRRPRHNLNDFPYVLDVRTLTNTIMILNWT